MVDKVRINDLARELEVKSKAILDVLPQVGVTEKKTHSSSITVDEAEKVKAHFRQGGGDGSSRSAPKRHGEEELKPKFDFSHISKPGDALKAILEKQHAPPPPPRAVPPAAAKPIAPVRPASAVTTPAAPVATKPAAPAAEAPAAPKAPAVPPAPVATAPVSAPPEKPIDRIEAETETREELSATPTTPAPRLITPQPRQAPRIVIPQPPAAPVEAEAQVTAESTSPTAPPATMEPAGPAVSAAPPAEPKAPAKPAAPQPPPRRLIVPQTGPRPVYTAPVRPPSQTPIAQRPAVGGGARPMPGRPVPGQPIFQRPRPQGATTGAPTGRPLRPGERRPMHPTRSAPGGMRPGMGGPGMAPPPPPGPTRAPGRRPGQRYVPRGVKEGPMKGFVPPPRMVVSNEPLPITRSITITEGISVKDLAEKLDIRAKDLIARLLARGVFATINQTLDADLATDMSRQFGASTDVITFEEQAEKEMASEATADEASTLIARPPVVTIMGHVDHGKTSLLDAIRHTTVAEGEAGGITQHIGAYKVQITDKNSPAYGREIVFLDTPGHEAFTRMRARGAKVTDIVVLVVAADDGVMPQTIEAIDHARAAGVPIIVAVNKIDKENALPERVKKQLADRGLMPEDWGGNTVFVDVSAKQKTNLNLLMEMICLVADLQELKANPDRAATGVVIEAKLDRGRGPVATILIENGTLHTGDYIVVGNVFGRVRAMFNDRGVALDQVGPSTPVEILGLEGLPQAGDQCTALADRDKAVGVSEYRQQKAREATLAKSSKVSLEGFAEQLKSAGTKELNIILKGDVQGSVEVLDDVLTKLSNEKVKIKIMRSGVGAITESDVALASASNAIIIGFNVRPERKAQELAEQEKVDIRLHSIIYELQDEIKRAMTGMLEPVFKETYLGRAEVRDTFRVPKVGTIAGSYVQDGLIKRDSQVRLLRDNVVVFTGKVGSLRRFKDDVSEVRNGMECGIGIAGYGDIKVGDMIEAFHTERVAPEAI
ncbi:MAG: translation initiation factor IF-2 [Terriglobales bacterium]